MNNIANTMKKLVAVIALGLMATACAPTSGSFKDIDYGSSYGTPTASTTSSISGMGYGF